MIRASFLLVMFFVSTTSSLNAADVGDGLDRAMRALLRSKCAICHDDRKSAAGGGVDNLLNLTELASGYVDLSAPTKSLLFSLTLGANPRMPLKRMKEVDWNGPLTASEKTTLEQWIGRGGPSDEYRAATTIKVRPVISNSQVAEFIEKDLAKAPGRQSSSFRYLTLTNLYNHRGISNDELELYRRGIVKMLNSLSRSSDVVELADSERKTHITAVDPDQTIYRISLEQIGWTDRDWERVARHDPFSLNRAPDVDRPIAARPALERLHLRADWFVFATSQPPLYHEIVGIPQTLAQLEESLGIERLKSIREFKVARAGMARSGVSVNNRLIERIPMTSRKGSYHISYDFAKNNGSQNIFDNPLGPPEALRTQFAFKHDGGEVIFPLKNGFQAYALVAGNGERIDVAPNSIVQDNTMPGSAIINGISCISCHYQGMKPERDDPKLESLDQVRSAALTNLRRFSSTDRDLISALFPKRESFREMIELDRQSFVDAMTTAGLQTNNSDEPVRALFDRFVTDLDLNSLASEFGLTPDECRSHMMKESETRQFLLRVESGTLKRQLFLTAFDEIARLIGAGDAKTRVPLPYPYFGEKVITEEQKSRTDSGADSPGVIAKSNIDLIDAEQRTGQFKLTLKTDDGLRNYSDGEVMRFFVRASRDCFLTIVSIDPVGEITLLLPNEWHPELKLKAGQTLTIPTPEMPFEFFARAPHGLTTIKAIGTSRPLDLKGVTRQSLRKGLVSLGNAKAIGVRKKDVELTERKLEEMFNPNEWATTSISIVTSEKTD